MANKNRKMVDRTSDFVPKFKIYDTSFTEKQKGLVRILRDKDSKVIFIKGVAGTAKSFCAVFGGLAAIRNSEKAKFLYIRAAVESCESKLYALPGSSLEKTLPFCDALFQKLAEFVDESVSDKLLEDKQIEVLSPNYLRGVTFKNSFVCFDEAQSVSKRTIITLLSRIGENTTIVLCYDPLQKDGKESGIEEISQLFDDEESRSKGIYNFEFTKDDILRSEILKYIMGRLEK